MRRRHPRAAAALLAVVLATAGCGGGPDGAADAPAAATPTPRAGEPTERATEGPGDADAALPPPSPHPTDDATSRAAALEAAAKVVAAFARPDLPEDRWWDELAPLLSPAAAEAYASTDPTTIPSHAVTGPPRHGPSPSPYLATVVVPTDVGEYGVLLVREGGGSPWLVERIAPLDAADPRTASAESQGA